MDNWEDFQLQFCIFALSVYLGLTLKFTTTVRYPFIWVQEETCKFAKCNKYCGLFALCL